MTLGGSRGCLAGGADRWTEGRGKGERRGRAGSWPPAPLLLLRTYLTTYILLWVVRTVY